MNIKLVVIGTSVVSAAAGAVAGYFYARKELVTRLNEEYDERLEMEIERTKDHYQALYKVGDENADPMTVLSRRTPKRPEGIEADDNEPFPNNRDRVMNPAEVAEAERLVQGLRYGPPNIVVEPATPGLKKTVNVFSHTEPTPGDPASDEKPYVLTAEEFHAGLLGHDTSSLTLYSDLMLVNEREEPMLDVPREIGLDNLKKFGADPGGDPNTIYIRNTRLGIDFEINRSEMTYAEVVGLGQGEDVASNVQSSKKATRRR
jgi:hypothetical protein